MITVTDLGLAYSGQPLFSHVDLQFVKGNCYGIIGANGAGKSTFLKILSGELEPTSGEVSILPRTRMSILKQDQNAYNQYTVMDTVIMGNQRLYDIGKEKEALYAKEEMTEEDGIKACELEEEYAELGGWEAESDASRILQGLGIPVSMHYDVMENVDGRLKVKVLLAQALFGSPDILMMDEPTNNLDINAINWLEDFLLDFPGTVQLRLLVRRLPADAEPDEEPEQEERGEGPGAQGVYLPLLGQQVQEQAGHRPPQAAGEDHPGGDPRLLPPLPLGGLQP